MNNHYGNINIQYFIILFYIKILYFLKNYLLINVDQNSNHDNVFFHQIKHLIFMVIFFYINIQLNKEFIYHFLILMILYLMIILNHYLLFLILFF
jgi:hypothetical protein